jgi:hypothetical protein
MSDRVAAVIQASSPITFAWSWRGTPIPVEYEISGPAGAEPILLLPAMSTVSTRDELRALAHYLETRRCVITDWPGFGDTARPRLDYDRAHCRGFLEELVDRGERPAGAQLAESRPFSGRVAQDGYSSSTAIPAGKPSAEPSSGHARSCEPTFK